MKSLRRSFNKEPPAISTPLSTYPAIAKPAAYQTPPKTVIRCIRAYRRQSPQELSCSVGDFLYVTREVTYDGGSWYEATNPTNNSRGIVPKTCFEELPKNGPTSIEAGPNARLPPNFNNRISSATQNTAKPPTKHQTFYAIVQYDFSAERPDELDAKAGEPISVVAQSNREWFVAKPIGRLGGPGLIPVSFVEIRDPLTNLAVKDVDALMDRGVLPRVEEWKQATAEYKASSIPLGVLDDLASSEGVKDSPFMKQAQFQQQQQPPQVPPSQPRPPQHDRSHSQAQSFATSSRVVSHAEPEPVPTTNPDILPAGNILSAVIPSFHYENDEYWFRIDATYQTADQPAPRTLQLILYRNYEDFYDFQISLLDAFPVEAGRVPPSDHANDNGYPTPPASVEEGSTRILPYMPGPVSFVDDMITSVRRTELDQYLKELCELEQRGAARVLQHELVRAFFSPKSGDVIEEIETPPVPVKNWQQNEPIEEEEEEGDWERRDGEDRYGEDTPYAQHQEEQDAAAEDIATEMERMHLKPAQSSNATRSRSSGDSYGGSSGPSRAGYPNNHNNDYDRMSNGGDRYSGADYQLGGRITPAGARSRGSSPQKNGLPRTLVEQSDSRPSSQSGNPNGTPGTPYSGAGVSGFYPSDPHSNYSNQGGHARGYSYSSSAGAGGGATLSPPTNHNPYSAGGGLSSGGGSRSARSSSGNPDDPAPAFLKIKIFHSESDDLIAIRVPPKVTYTQLISKVRDRLGAGVSVLRYRDSLDGSSTSSNRSWKEIDSDGDLRDWINRGDKLVLYAD